MRPRRHTVSDAALRRWPLPRPDITSSKEERGQVLVIGGSRDVPGAVRLAGESGLRAGAGKLQVATVRSAAIALGVALPEARVIGVPETPEGHVGSAWLSVRRPALRADAVLVGPGMTATPATRRVAQQLNARIEAPLVLDAGSLTPGVFKKALGPRLITPHSGEMATLIDAQRERVEADPVATAHAFARQHAVIVVLKGEMTVIADGTEVWIHEQGVPGLGTSGSGDVLAGLMTGLLARGAQPVQAAAWAVHLHALAGKTLAQHIGTVGFLARELLPLFPGLLTRLALRSRPTAGR